MIKPPAEVLYDIFEEKMAQMCSVVPSGHSKNIVSDEWFSYVDSLRPAVESIRPSARPKSDWSAPKKNGNMPLLSMLMDRINDEGFDRLVIEDPGISSRHVPTWGPNLLLIDRDFADKILVLGGLP